MSDSLVPKQIRLTQAQDLLLKRLAIQRGVSQSEVLRQVLEHEIRRADPKKEKAEK